MNFSQIQDLTLILVTAGVVSLIFRYFHLPIVLGYLLAGYFVGPHFPLIPNITHIEGIKVWSEIGIIFLMFGLGLEFSFRKLKSIGGASLLAGAIEVITVILFGIGIGLLLKLDFISSIFLGAVLSISSTSIVIKTISDLRLKHRGVVPKVFGLLIVEDLVAIVFLTLFPMFVLKNNIVGTELAQLVLNLILFLTFWFFLGWLVLPKVFSFFAKALNEESLLIIAIAFCFGMVEIAERSGFSKVLGAFVMGSILSEIGEGKKIEQLFSPLKNIFLAVFFVTIGMLFDPTQLLNNWSLVIIFFGVVFIGKLVGVFCGLSLTGNSLRHSLQGAVFLPQIGEFSFVLGAVGVGLKLINEEFMAAIVTTAVLTNIVSPYLIKRMDRLAFFIENNAPKKVLMWHGNYQSFILTHQNTFNHFFRKIFDILLAKFKGRKPLLTQVGSIRSRLTPWDAALVDYVISPMSGLCGQTLESSQIREKYGVIVTIIDRGSSRIFASTKNIKLLAGDIVFVIGSEEDLQKFEKVAEVPHEEIIRSEVDDVKLTPIYVNSEHSFLNKTIKESGIREASNGIIVGVERDGARILNPSSNFVIKENDLLWIVVSGSKKI